MADLTSVYKLIAPRALAIEVGRQDRSFPWKDTEQLLDQVSAHYARVSAEQRFHQTVKEGDHVFGCTPQTLAFLQQMTENYQDVR